MNEKDVVAKTSKPNTVETLIKDFNHLGLKPGMTVLVHSSLSAIGWVVGREHAVVLALMNLITEEGTIIMPAQSGELSDPKTWGDPAVPEAWWQTIRDTMPAFDPVATPTRGVGRIVECFRNFKGVVRSNHPAVSFAAWGKYADEITANHSLEVGLGKGSPLQKIYDLDGYVLLLGVGHGNSTSLHLSECYDDTKKTYQAGAPIIENGQRIWKEYPELEYNDDEFEEIGKKFEETHSVLKGHVGNATARLMKQRELVDFGVQWFEENAEI